MEFFFKVKKPEEVYGIIDQFGPFEEETIPLEHALGRVLNEDFVSPEDLPGFFRSTMDGYAVKAKDTFGAGEGLPALFEICGEVQMGEQPRIIVNDGQAAKISTGGMLPKGADGVVMIEYCNALDEKTIEVNRSISPLTNVIQPHDDFKKGGIVLNKGILLRPQDLGIMAGLGQTKASIYKKPKIGIISTGDEIVPVEKVPKPGQMRDINRYTLAAFAKRVGGDPLFMGICPDNFQQLKGLIEDTLHQTDTIWISGGSSVGTRDLTLKALETLPDFELMVHGISISPGKPTIIGRSGRKPVIGLPGHVGSALVIAEVFLARLIFKMSGRAGTFDGFSNQVEARLSRNIESANGREEYIRVKLTRQGDTLICEPLFGKSGLISTMVDSDGLVKVDMNTEGLYEGQLVKVMLSRNPSFEDIS